MEKGFWNKLKAPVIGLAPMDGVSDAPFRAITAKYGHPSITFTEFINVEGLAHGALKIMKALQYDEIERPIVGQIYGVTPEAFYQACFVLAELGFDGIDINMGCPSKSVSGNGGGAGLIRTPMLAQEIILSCKQATKDWANGKTIYEAKLHRDLIEYLEKNQTKTPLRKELPISVKTRIGYDTPITAEWLKYLIECQPANITVHGRTLKQMYSGQADWEEIALAAKLVKEANANISILGNGDIKSHQDALEKIKNYQVDGVLIGRAAFGNPWIFSGENQDLNTKLRVAIEHSYLHEQVFGQNPKAFAAIKKHLGWYSTDFPHAKDLRIKLMACNSAQEVAELIQKENLL